MCGFCTAAELADPCAVKGPGSLQTDLDEISPETIGLSIPASTSTTETITIGGTRDETLETVGDRDWFRIELTAGDVIQIDLFGLDHDSGNGLGELVDPYVRMRDVSGAKLAENDDINLGIQRDSRLVFQAESTETYFIEVDSYLSEYTGDYRLQVTEIVSSDAIPATISTAESISVGATLNGTLDFAGDSDWFRIELEQGEIIQIDLRGNNHDSSNGFSALTDPAVGIRDASGNLLSADNNSGPGADARLMFQAPTAGTYFIDASSNQNSLTGDYQLQVSASSNAPSPVDAMQTIFTLNTDDPVLVYFAEAGDTYNYNGDVYTATGVNAYEQTQLFSVFEGVEEFIDIDFQITTNRSAADLEWATDTLPRSNGGTLLGFFFFPSSNGNGGYGVLNNNSSSFPSWNSTPGGTLDTGGFMYGVAVHELGHGLGLGHPHDNGGGSEIMQGVSSSSSRGTFGLNSSPFTALSYNEGWADNPAGLANSVASTGHGATFGALDIAALQNMYGANTTHANGNDVYELHDSNTTGSGAGYYATWDTGGIDEFRYTGTRDATIDLRDATLFYENGGGGFMSHVSGVIAGRTIANGVVIENATGGEGDDTLTGNAADNLLSGNGGNDSLLGGAGDDTLDGGAGNDTVSAGDGDDTIIYTSGQDSIDGGDGSDWLDLRGVSGDANFSLLTNAAIDGTPVDVQNVENLLLSDVGNAVQDNNGNNTIIGGAGDDTISIQGGDDSVDGGAGLDVLFLRDQTTTATDPDFTIDIGAGTATGSNGEVNSFQNFETIVAGGGVNTVIGGTGDDTVVTNAANDVFALGGGNDSASAGAGDDTIDAGAGGDTVFGGDGEDQIIGGAGDDSLSGGSDADTFEFDFGDGFDTIADFEIGTDLIDFVGLGIAFTDLTIADVSGNAQITYDFTTSGQITLTGVDAADLTAASFLVDVSSPPTPLPKVPGTTGDDNLAGSAAGEELLGFAGNDILNGRAGADVLRGGTGNDRYYLDNAGDTVIEEAGEGYDRAYSSVSFTLADHVEAGATLGAGAIDITGNSQVNWITGNAASNGLKGGGGNDRLISYGGDDTLNGEGGNDVLEGGDGADVFAFDTGSGTDLITDFEIGLDVIDVSSLGIAYADMAIVDVGTNAIVVWDDPGAVGTRGIIVLNNVSASDLLLSSFATSFGNNQPAILGTAGNDVIVGSQIGDELQGLGGNDLLNGADGDDTMIGGEGNDSYYVDDAGDQVIEQSGEGQDRVYASIDHTLSSDVEDLSAVGTGAIALTGNASVNWMTGNAAANVLSGMAGNDRLNGLVGGDTLEGGTGNDLLEGGADADTFVFNAGDGTDSILDFEDGVDLIDVSSLGISFGDLRIVDSGANAIIFYDETDPADRGLIVVNGHSASQFTDADFIFV